MQCPIYNEECEGTRRKNICYMHSSDYSSCSRSLYILLIYRATGGIAPTQCTSLMRTIVCQCTLAVGSSSSVLVGKGELYGPKGVYSSRQHYWSIVCDVCTDYYNDRVVVYYCIAPTLIFALYIFCNFILTR